ncbi:MAG: imidazolonepropionase-like amidohydrolase [Gammaproteobacteria bacterium]|jgi:imidazolonepropionase-like amidohydrolase
MKNLYKKTTLRISIQANLYLFLLLFSTTITAQTKYIYCGHLIDGTDKEVKTEQTIIVEEGNIQAVKSGYATAPEGTEIIDLKDHYVMPGFMDMHVHLEFESNPKGYENRFRNDPADVALQATQYCERTLMAGFTTVRDLGGSGVNVSLQKAVARGFIRGPRIYTAEKALATTGGHADPTNGVRSDLKGDPGPKEGVVNSVEDAKKAVRQRYKNGADCIKITATGGVLSVAKDGSGPQFTLEEIKAIVATAKDYGMTTAAHAHGVEGMRRAIIGGINSIEHGTYMDEETMDLMIKHGTYYVPTILAGNFVAAKAKIPGYYPDIVVPKALAIGPQIQTTFAKAYKHGVKIAFGTDSGVSFHGDNAREFALMVEAGMPPMEAIISATVNTADLMQITDKAGTIEKGKWADVVAVKGNPLEGVEVLQRVQFVMKGGEVVKKGGVRWFE